VQRQKQFHQHQQTKKNEIDGPAKFEPVVKKTAPVPKADNDDDTKTVPVLRTPTPLYIFKSHFQITTAKFISGPTRETKLKTEQNNCGWPREFFKILKINARKISCRTLIAHFNSE
jgi:hypothetical protein